MANSINKKLRDGNMTIKLDIQKAFDRVFWNFLQRVLKAFGFSEHSRLFVKNSSENNFFSILINGAPLGFFKTGQGVKQGDPLSPLLFIIIADILSRGLKALLLIGGLKPYALSRGCMHISHISFVDDIIIFTNGGIFGLRILMDFLD